MYLNEVTLIGKSNAGQIWHLIYSDITPLFAHFISMPSKSQHRPAANFNKQTPIIFNFDLKGSQSALQTIQENHFTHH